MDSDGPLYIDESEDRAAKIFKPSTPDALTQTTPVTSSSVSSSSSADEESGYSQEDTSSPSLHDTTGLSHLTTLSCDSPSDKISSHESSLPSISSNSDFDKDIKPVVGFGLIRDHFTCGICHGILVDAFTIVECLHSFCRSCLIHNTYSSASCPTCGYKLDQVTPFKEIKCDRKVQDLVNAVFPEIRERERAARTTFYWGLGLPPYVDKVYVDSINSLPPPGALEAATVGKYDCARINLLQSRSNKVWFRLTAYADTSKPKHFNKLLKKIHDNHRYISCPCYIRVGALLVALDKKLRGLTSTTTKFNLNLFYNKEKLSREISIKEIYFVHHKYGKFPIDISLSIKPVFRGVPQASEPCGTSKPVVMVSELMQAPYCQKITADGELKRSEGNVFANFEFCNGFSKSDKPTENAQTCKNPENAQTRKTPENAETCKNPENAQTRKPPENAHKPEKTKTPVSDSASSHKREKKKKRSCKTKSKKPKASVNEAPLFAADPIKLTKFEPIKIPCSSAAARQSSAICSSPKKSKVEIKREPSDAISHRMNPDWRVKEQILSNYVVVVANPIDAKVIEKEKKKCKQIDKEVHRKKAGSTGKTG